MWMIQKRKYTPIHLRAGFLDMDCYRQSKITLNDGIIIKNNRRFLKRSIEMNDCISYDSETYKGFCKLLASSKGKYILNPTFKECLDFLYSNCRYKQTYHFFFNIDFDISAIIKLARADFSSLKEFNIFLKKLLAGNQVIFQDYKITWIKEKLFVLKKNKKNIYFTDINNFLHMKLDKAIKEYVDNTLSKDKISGKLLNESLDYWNQNLDDIIKYCIKDCILTNKLGKVLIDNIEKAGIELPRFLISSASLSKQHFRLHCKIPSIHYIPKCVLQASYDSYAGGRFEIFKRGYFKNAYLYDIVSEYPTKIRDLPSLKYGYWNRVNSVNKKEVIGFYKARIFIPPEVEISPMVFTKNDVNLWITGYQEAWFTWYDLDLMRKDIIEIVIGYEYISNHYEYYPFREVIDDLAFKKEKYKAENNKIMILPVKLTMNAFYGTTLEKHEKILKNGKKIIEGGVLFNPVYASIITSYGRWRLMKDIKPINYKHILAFHTDSVISKIKLKELEIGTSLGKWSLEASGKCLIINTGMYQISNKKCKSRGIPHKFIKNWFKFASQNKDIAIKEFKKEKMIKIREALKQDKHLARLNLMDNVKRSVDINSDKKRTWNGKFENFKELSCKTIDSLPHFNLVKDSYETILIKNPIIIERQKCKV